MGGHLGARHCFLPAPVPCVPSLLRDALLLLLSFPSASCLSLPSFPQAFTLPSLTCQHLDKGPSPPAPSPLPQKTPGTAPTHSPALSQGHRSGQWEPLGKGRDMGAEAGGACPTCGSPGPPVPPVPVSRRAGAWLPMPVVLPGEPGHWGPRDSPSPRQVPGQPRPRS